MNEAALQNLHAFVLIPSYMNLTLLINAPALYAVAEGEFNGTEARISATTLGVFRWIYMRAYVVLHLLKAQGSGASKKMTIQGDDWQKVLDFVSIHHVY